MRNDAFPPIEAVNKSTVPTDQAGFYLHRKPQTLRSWSCLDNGPIRPVRINRRLAWKVSDIKQLLENGG